jgi:hypothetical protein
MRLSSKLAVVCSAGMIAAVPAVALAGSDHPGPHPGKPHGPTDTTGPSGPSGPTGPGGSHKCKAHKIAYVAGGKVESSSLTKNSDGTYSGTLVVDVAKADHAGKTDKGKTVTYTLNHARVKFDHGTANPPAAGDRVQVIGKVTTLSKHCDHTGFTPTVTVRQVVVHPPAKPKTGPSGPSGPSGPTGSSSTKSS